VVGTKLGTVTEHPAAAEVLLLPTCFEASLH